MLEEIWIFTHEVRFWIAYILINVCFLWGVLSAFTFLLEKIIQQLGLQKQILEAAFKIIIEKQK